MRNVNCGCLTRFRSLALNILQVRYAHQSQRDDGNGNQNKDDTYSSYHQNYHRQSYERKKSRYNGQENESNNSDDAAPINSDINHYQRLNIEQGADTSTIKSAYYSLSKLYHPDVIGSGDPKASENFRLITESYDVLTDPKSRLEYDKQLEVSRSPSSTSAWKPSGTNNTNNDHMFKVRDADLIFRSRQDAALELEKKRNPRKFQAGAFKKDPNESLDRRLELEKVEQRLQSLRLAKSSTGRNDGYEFYRAHLYDSIHRKRTDLMQSDQKIYGRPSDDSAGYYGVVLFILVNIFIISRLIFNDLDIAGNLDSYLELKMKELRERQAETQKKED